MADAVWTKQTDNLRITLAGKQPLRAGEDIELTFAIHDAVTGKPAAGMEPYLGAWAHFIIIDERKQNFIHAHPLETALATSMTANGFAQSHTHDAQSPGPPPDEIRVLTSFPRPGLYKLWAQFQRNGQVIIQPFVVQVGAPQSARCAGVAIPPDAIKFTIGSNGFYPHS